MFKKRMLFIYLIGIVFSVKGGEFHGKRKREEPNRIKEELYAQAHLIFEKFQQEKDPIVRDRLKLEYGEYLQLFKDTEQQLEEFNEKKRR